MTSASDTPTNDDAFGSYPGVTTIDDIDDEPDMRTNAERKADEKAEAAKLADMEREADEQAALARAEIAEAKTFGTYVDHTDEPAETAKSELEVWCDAEKAWLDAPLTKWVQAENIWKYSSVEFDWKHETEAYEGDCLGIRIPSQSALTAFQLGTGIGSPDDTRQAMTVMFIQKHLSPRSYLHVFGRMMDPNDDYTDDKLSALMSLLVTKASDAIVAEHKAKAEAEKAAKQG